MAYPTRLAPGQILGDRFQVASLVGSGDLGEVYDVREVGTGYPYAVKTLPAALLHTPGITSFQQIAQRVTDLHHDALLGVYAFDVEATTQQPYVLRELVPTPSLQRMIETNGPLRATDLVPIVTGIAAALDALHTAGLVHGNLKPANVFPVPATEASAALVRLADVGCSYLRGPLGEGGLWGSPGYVPFEQTSAPAEHPTADLYALGVVVFFALTGRLPFRATQGSINLAALVVELQAALPPASHRARELGAPLGSELDAWFSRALATSPGARFPSAQSLAESFRAAALTSSEPGFAAPETTGSYTHKGTLMLGQLTPDVAALVAGATGQPAAPPAGGLKGTLLLATAPTGGAMPNLAPLAVAITAKPERPLASTELATVPPGRLPAPPSLNGASYEPGGPSPYDPPAAAKAAPAATSLPPMSGPVSTPAGVPKKSKAGLLIGLLVAAIVGGGAIFAVLFLFVFRDAPEKSEMTPNTAASASAAPTASVAAIATSAAPVDAPPAATSAAPAVVEAKDALITLTCEPGCDAVVCDKKPVANAAAGVRLLPGTHTCTGRKAGFASATITFTTTAGTDGAQTLTLTKNAAPPSGGGNKPPCGTFVNPCK